MAYEMCWFYLSSSDNEEPLKGKQDTGEKEEGKMIIIRTYPKR